MDGFGGPYVNPPGGLVGDEEGHIAGKLPGGHHLLHIAAGEHPQGVAAVLALDAKLPDQLPAEAVQPPHPQQGAILPLLHPVGDQVIPDGAFGRAAVEQPVLGDVGHLPLPQP